MLRKYKHWVLLPLILLGVQWSVLYWHHHEETIIEETQWSASHAECFVCDWLTLVPSHVLEVPLISAVVGVLFLIGLILESVYTFQLEIKSSAFFFGRAPPVEIR